MANFQEYVNQVTRNHQNSIEAVFNINVSILDTPICVSLNSILIQTWNHQ